MKKRKTKKFKKRLIKRSRFKKSAIPYMVDLLNKGALEKEKNTEQLPLKNVSSDL